MIKIIEVKTKKQLNEFVKFPYKLYKDHPYWVPPIKSTEYKRFSEKKNPLFSCCDVKLWLAYSENNVVGRIAGIIHHRYNELWNKKYCRFGFIDFIDDKKVSTALINEVQYWAKSNNLDTIHGPLGFTDLDPQGTLIEGFDIVSNMVTIYNQDYYQTHFEALGLEKDVDWVEHKLTVPQRFPKRIELIANKLCEKFQLTVINTKKKKELLPYMNDIFSLMNTAYKDLYGVIPLDKREIEYYFNEFKDIIIPEYIPLIFDKDNKLIAFAFGFPGIAKTLQKIKGTLFPFNFLKLLSSIKNHSQLELGLIAVDPKYQHTGLPALLFYKGFQHVKEKGITSLLVNPQLETNKSVQAFWKYVENEKIRRRRCFIKSL